MLCDTHTHLAPYSHDARQKLSELLAFASDRKLAAVCTADHYEKDIFYEGGREDIFDIQAYFADLTAVQATLTDRGPRLLIGVEMGYLPHLDVHFSELTVQWPFDSVILSLHILEGEDPYINKDMYRAGPADVYGRYLRQMTEMIDRCPDFDILGHFDYISRYAPYPDRKIRYAEFPAAFDNLLKALSDKGKALEINTRTIVKLQSCGYQDVDAWPDPVIIQRHLAFGGLISLGSDAHKPDEAGNLFEETAAWLRQLGCTRVVHFEKRLPVFTSL